MKSKFFIYFFLFVFSICISSANEISIFPNQINFEGNIGERICQNITIKTENKINIISKDLWAEEGIFERQLSLHNLNSSSLGLDLEYQKNLTVENKKNLEICMVGKSGGNYHGALLYRIEGKPIQVGIWINSTIHGGKLFSLSEKNSENVQNKKTNFSFGLILSFMFLLILGILIKRYKL